MMLRDRVLNWYVITALPFAAVQYLVEYLPGYMYVSLSDKITLSVPGFPTYYTYISVILLLARF